MKKKLLNELCIEERLDLEFARDVVVQVHLIAGKHVIIVMVQVQ